jgi:hypothetical protein
MVIIMIILENFGPKTYSWPVGTVRPGFLSILDFGLYFFEINIIIAIKVFISFRIWCLIRIWNQISIKIFSLKTKNGQTEFERVPILAFFLEIYMWIKSFIFISI